MKEEQKVRKTQADRPGFFRITKTTAAYQLLRSTGEAE
jgi:hypothetical protein